MEQPDRRKRRQQEGLMLNRMLNRLRGRKEKLTEAENIEGAKRRERIIADAEAMKRLSENADYKRYCELLLEDRQGLVDNLLAEDTNNMKSAEQKIRLIARINQIDRDLKKPKSLIWQMENLTEIRNAIKEQTHERQALGKKTGG